MLGDSTTTLAKGASRVLVSARESRMKILLNASLTFSSDQRAALLAGSPDVELIETCVDSPEKLDGEGVSILVTEQVPA